MKKTFLAAISALAVLLSPAAVFAGAYNGTSVAPAADGQTYTVNATSGDVVNLSNVGGSGGTLAITFNGAASGSVKVVPSQTLPTSAPTAPTGKVSTYYDVSLVGIPASSISSATWNFSVAKSWLSSVGLAATNIVMYHYNGTSWVALTTTQGTADATNYNFSAVTPSFSPFAVVAAPGLSNTGFPYALTMLVAGGALVVIAASFVLTRKKAHSA